MRLIVADAGPLIALSRIRRLGVLREMFDEVMLPSLVVDELRLHEQRPGVEELARAILREKWLRIRKPRITLPIAGLADGEVAAIHLSEQLRCPLLVDERRARRVAAGRGIPTVGTGRILIEAKRLRLIDRVDVELAGLRLAGYRLSDALCRQILSLAGEGEKQ
jgi:predicted nucleic acid-binding protein